MQAISNKQLISLLEKQVEEQTQLAVTVFQNMDEDALLKPSATGGWSITQCLAHLNTYGNYYLPLIKKALDKAETVSPEALFKSGWLGNYFTRMVEPVSGKRKMKAAKQHIPATDLNAYQTVAEFIQQQETLLAYLQLAVERNLNRAFIPVSIARLIRLKTGDVLLFLVAHNTRHIEQAKRNTLLLLKDT